MAEGISFNESQRGTNSPQDVDRFFHPFKLTSVGKEKGKRKEGKEEKSGVTRHTHEDLVVIVRFSSL